MFLLGTILVRRLFWLPRTHARGSQCHIFHNSQLVVCFSPGGKGQLFLPAMRGQMLGALVRKLEDWPGLFLQTLGQCPRKCWLPWWVTLFVPSAQMAPASWLTYMFTVGPQETEQLEAKWKNPREGRFWEMVAGS